MRPVVVALAAALTVACAAEPAPTSHVDAPCSRGNFTLDHEVSGVPCGWLYSISPDVMLECPDGDELVPACDASQGAVLVFARPGAGDGQPFGVASLIELDSSGCGGVA
jgi:hypothetical protein